ncbi:MAG: beta-propeller domain-containing protein [Bradymonadales bacterium]|nr:beta-propeller domain-containing protein [Bradymonadales bacterium]
MRSPNFSHGHRTSLWLGCFALSVVLLGSACQFGPLSPLDPSQARLVKFSSCGDLESHLKAEALRTAQVIATLGTTVQAYDPFGFATQGDLPSGVSYMTGSFSTTNNQEAGVDEADIFQVDGTHAFALHRNRLVIIEAIGTATPDPDGGPVYMSNIQGGQVAAEVYIEGTPLEMFLIDNTVVVMTRVRHGQVAMQFDSQGPDRDSTSSLVKVLLFDVANRHDPQLVREVALEGDFVASRRIGDFVYVIARADLGGVQGSNTQPNMQDWLSEQSGKIMGSSLDSWLPFVFNKRYEDGNLAEESIERCDCQTAYAASGTPGDDVLGIYSIDIRDGSSRVTSTTVVGDGTLVYASTDSIILALTNYAQVAYMSAAETTSASDSSSWDDWEFGWDDSEEPEEVELDEDTEVTYLHRFELDDLTGEARYQASGLVHGWILNQFSLSEHDGYVRVATAIDRGTWEARSALFTLPVVATEPDPGMVMMSSSSSEGGLLHVAGEITDIGFGEELFAVRFKENLAYLVTFQGVDPLWIVDLSDQTDPRVRGELTVPGFSTYIHPISNHRLLAIGQNLRDIDDDPEGIKLSIFDVSDLDWPRSIQERLEGGRGSTSEALTEHRAFRYIPDFNLLAVPMEHSSSRGLYLYSILDRGFEAQGVIDHGQLIGGAAGSVNVRRAYHIGNYLYAFSDAGVSITDLRSFNTAAVISLTD